MLRLSLTVSFGIVPKSLPGPCLVSFLLATAGAPDWTHNRLFMFLQMCNSCNRATDYLPKIEVV